MTSPPILRKSAAAAAILSVLLSGANPAGPAQAQQRAADTELRDGYRLAFVEADVRRVIDAVLGSMLELDYSVDPAVTGNVTLRTQRAVPRESLLPLLESALRPLDAVILVQGSSYRVVPRKLARNRAPVASAETPAGSPVAGYASDLVTLRNGSAGAVARLLEQFLGKGIVAATPA